MASVDVLTHVSEPAPATAPATAPPRSVRRATAQRASARRAFARSRHRDGESSIIGFLIAHPHSTVGDLARGLNFDPDYVATCLARLTFAGEIEKASDGYATIQPPTVMDHTPLGSMAGQSE
jgi:hypothetical protein